MSSDHSEAERLTQEFEQLWAKTWETDKGKAPDPQELRSHPLYQITLNAWLEGHGVEPPTS